MVTKFLKRELEHLLTLVDRETADLERLAALPNNKYGDTGLRLQKDIHRNRHITDTLRALHAQADDDAYWREVRQENRRTRQIAQVR